jgi:hypothetical protein
MVQPKSEGRVEIEASGDQAGALQELLTGARHVVRIFSDYLSPQLFDHAGITAELSRVARHGPPCEVRILIKNSQFLVKSAHRIGALHQRLVSSVVLRKLSYCPDHFVPNYVLVDDSGIFFIPNEDDKICFWNRDDRPLVRHYTEQFDDLWQRSGADPEMRFMPM